MASSSTFSFFSLPPELRIHIYTYLLCPTPGQSIILYDSCKDPPATLNIHPAILRSNKKIYHEALPLFHSNIYGFNFLKARCPEPMPETDIDDCYLKQYMKLPWKDRVDQEHLKHLKHIEIRTTRHIVGWMEQSPVMLMSDIEMMLRYFLKDVINRFDDDRVYTTCASQRTFVFRIVVSGYDDVEFFLIKEKSNDHVKKKAGKTLRFLEAVRGTRVDRINLDDIKKKGRRPGLTLFVFNQVFHEQLPVSHYLKVCGNYF